MCNSHFETPWLLRNESGRKKKSCLSHPPLKLTHLARKKNIIIKLSHNKAEVLAKKRGGKKQKWKNQWIDWWKKNNTWLVKDRILNWKKNWNKLLFLIKINRLFLFHLATWWRLLISHLHALIVKKLWKGEQSLRLASRGWADLCWANKNYLLRRRRRHGFIGFLRKANLNKRNRFNHEENKAEIPLSVNFLYLKFILNNYAYSDLN